MPRKSRCGKRSWSLRAGMRGTEGKTYRRRYRPRRAVLLPVRFRGSGAAILANPMSSEPFFAQEAAPFLPEVLMARTPKTRAPEVFAAKTRKTRTARLRPKIHPPALPVKGGSPKPPPALQGTDRVVVSGCVRNEKRGLSKRAGPFVGVWESLGARGAKARS